MGRPLNKKYFGNRNIGSLSTTSDNYGIGGEGLAAYTLPGQKGVVAITNTYKYFPTLTIPSPNLAAGVQATATVVWELSSISLSSGGSGYTANQTGVAITSLSGSIWTAATTRPTITVDTGAGGDVTAVYLNGSARGEWTSVAGAPVSSAIDGTGITTWAIVGPGGSNAQITAFFRLKTITTVEKGSGYTSAPTLSWYRASSQTAGGQTQTGTPTVALTTDSGAVGSSTNQENAIICYAKTTSGGTRQIGDIIKQVSTTRYKVQTPDGIAVCQLVTDGSTGYQKMDITAWDTAGQGVGEYWVKKLTSRVTEIVRKASNYGTVFATGARVKWTLTGSAVDPVGLDYGTVVIENA